MGPVMCILKAVYNMMYTCIFLNKYTLGLVIRALVSLGFQIRWYKMIFEFQAL